MLKEILMNKKPKQRMSERLCEALDLPTELLPRHSLVEIHGRNLVKIQGAGRILLYTHDEIRISLCSHDGVLCIKGQELCCNSYNMGAIGIQGVIQSVGFCEKEVSNEKHR